MAPKFSKPKLAKGKAAASKQTPSKTTIKGATATISSAKISSVEYDEIVSAVEREFYDKGQDPAAGDRKIGQAFKDEVDKRIELKMKANAASASSAARGVTDNSNTPHRDLAESTSDLGDYSGAALVRSASGARCVGAAAG